jgi:hypothetical protein
MESEKEKLTQLKRSQQRKRDFERIRKSHETETQTEGTSPPKLVTIRDQGGRVIGWIQEVGKNRFNFFNGQTRLVGSFINGQTYDHRGQFVGGGNQGLRLLGQSLK